MQPPVHAIAVMKIYRASGDKQFVREIFPQLLAWHNYLYRERDPHHEHLVYVRHPWESGMDNAPSWDAAFKRMVLKKGDVPPYQRKDNKVKGVDEKDRPTDFYYDRYVALMKIFYDNAYNETKIAEKCPFLIQDVLFNAILGRAEEDLAQLADIIGEPSEHLHNRARMTQSSILTKLWNVEDAAFYDFDLQSGESVKTRIGGGIAGIFGATLSGSNLERFLSMLDSEAAEGRLGTHAGYPVPTVFTDDNLFMANNYWRGKRWVEVRNNKKKKKRRERSWVAVTRNQTPRCSQQRLTPKALHVRDLGPVWVNINYLLIDGLLSSGSDAAKLSARHLFEKTIELVYKSGFYEYFSPLDASPHGASNFSWTASLLIDLICDGDRRAMLYASSHSHRLGNFFPSCIFVSLLLCGLSMLAWKKQSIDRAQEQNQVSDDFHAKSPLLFPSSSAGVGGPIRTGTTLPLPTSRCSTRLCTDRVLYRL